MSDVLEIESDVRVAAEPEAAFRYFSAEIGAWWPSEYTWSGENLVGLELGAGEGGLLHEYGPAGVRCDWGRVLSWEPPGRLRFAWQIGPSREPIPDLDKATEVEVTFAPDDGGTRVTVTHMDFERHGEAAASYRDALGSAQGWPYLLECFETGIGAA